VLRLPIFADNPWRGRARLVFHFKNPITIAIPDGATFQIVTVCGIGALRFEKSRYLLFDLLTIHADLQIEGCESGNL
jgi:hypothetical protein